MTTKEITIEFWGRMFALRYDRQARQWFAVDLDPARGGEAMAVANTREDCAFALGLNLAHACHR